MAFDPGAASRRAAACLALALALACAAGAASVQGGARWQLTAALLLLASMALALTAWRARAPVRQLAPPPPALPDDGRTLRLQTQLEHLPAAAWVLSNGQLQPLSVRAHRLMAPGGARDAAALQAQLREHASQGHSGQLLIDTERGAERWSLALQRLHWDGQEQMLLVLMPLESELEAERMDAWRQLVQVLTHEIMNSLTPISSLSQSALALLDEPGAEADLRTALDAIARRAQGLRRFVNDYRRVSDWPQPCLAPVDLQALLARLEAAVAPAWQARGGRAHFELQSPSLRLVADADQLEQALLNLLRNAEQATQGTLTPQLWVEARLSRGGRLRISVRDNGPGVPAGLEQQIFLPFFSATEHRDDATHGIGLTVARQLVHGMGGRLRHVRPLEGGAAFVVSF